MEKAYLITESTDFDQLRNRLDTLDRVYIWDAYCEHNLFYFLSDISFMETVISLWKPITLTTPIISNRNIDRLLSYIEENKRLPGFEVVVNDHWVFHHLRKNMEDVQLIWGNFLAWQNKDPFLKIFKDKEVHKRMSIDNGYYKDFFRENNISSVEIYNVFQWLELQQEYNLTLYYPYVVYSINRYCPTKLISDKKRYLTVVEDCDGCVGKKPPNLHMDLKMKTESSRNFLRGNKQFYENENSIEDARITRIIYNYDLIW